MPANGQPSNNPDGRPTDRGKAKKRAQITLTQDAKDILAQSDNPIKAAGWKSLSELAEAMLRGEVRVPDPPKKIAHP